MPRKPIDLVAQINNVLSHVGDLPSEAEAPLAHYKHSANDSWTTLRYFDRKVQRTPTYKSVFGNHMHRLNSMLIVQLVDAFERFLKEIAALCVDFLVDFAFDDRFDVFQLKGSVAAAHFQEGSIGKSLCESCTWIDCDEINKRFRRILAKSFDGKGAPFFVFPKMKGQEPDAERRRYFPMQTIFQMRHTIVHNVGLVTRSDAVKFTHLTRQNVMPQKVLMPSKADLRFIKRFLDDTADAINKRIAIRLVDLLTEFHEDYSGAIDAKAIETELSKRFGMSLKIGAA